jgi:hypothetical protein
MVGRPAEDACLCVAEPECLPDEAFYLFASAGNRSACRTASGSTPSPPASLTATPPCKAPCRIRYSILSRSQMAVWKTSLGLGAAHTTQRTRDEVVQADV